jgi:hypothetical protein
MGPEDLDESSSSQFIPIDVVLKAAKSCGHFVSFGSFALVVEKNRRCSIVVHTTFSICRK